MLNDFPHDGFNKSINFFLANPLPVNLDLQRLVEHRNEIFFKLFKFLLQ